MLKKAVRNAARQAMTRSTEAVTSTSSCVASAPSAVTNEIQERPAAAAAAEESASLFPDLEDGYEEEDDDLYISSPELLVEDAPDLELLRALEGTTKVSVARSLLDRLGDLAGKQGSVGGIESIQADLDSGISHLFVKVRNYAKAKQDEGEDVSCWIWGANVTNTDYIPDEDTRDTVAAVHSDIAVEAMHPQKGHQVSCGYTVTSAYLPDQGRWTTTLKLLRWPDRRMDESQEGVFIAQLVNGLDMIV